MYLASLIRRVLLGQSLIGERSRREHERKQRLSEERRNEGKERDLVSPQGPEIHKKGFLALSKGLRTRTLVTSTMYAIMPRKWIDLVGNISTIQYLHTAKTMRVQTLMY